MNRVLIVGDSRRMKGGVSTVISSWECSYIWEKYNCYWLQCQINSSFVLKLLYLIRGLFIGLFIVPFYSIIHFHTTPGNSMIVQMPIYLYSLLWRKKIIIHLHVGNQLEQFINNRVFIFVLKHADLVLTLGNKWKLLLEEKLPIKLNVDYLYNPAPGINKQNKYSKYFLFAAYLNINKGYDTLIKAFSLIKEKYYDWKLVICGTGDVKEVKKLIRKYGVESQVELPGWIVGEDKERFFKNAFAYCMTSKQEGLPMSVLESMSYGVPVISTPVGCLPDFLIEKENVLFFDYGNEKELSKKMELLIDNICLRKQLVNNALCLIKEQFSIEQISHKLDSIYQTLLNK